MLGIRKSQRLCCKKSLWGQGKDSERGTLRWELDRERRFDKERLRLNEWYSEHLRKEAAREIQRRDLRIQELEQHSTWLHQECLRARIRVCQLEDLVAASAVGYGKASAGQRSQVGDDSMDLDPPKSMGPAPIPAPIPAPVPVPAPAFTPPPPPPPSNPVPAPASVPVPAPAAIHGPLLAQPPTAQQPRHTAPNNRPPPAHQTATGAGIAPLLQPNRQMRTRTAPRLAAPSAAVPVPNNARPPTPLAPIPSRNSRRSRHAIQNGQSMGHAFPAPNQGSVSGAGNSSQHPQGPSTSSAQNAPSTSNNTNTGQNGGAQDGYQSDDSGLHFGPSRSTNNQP